MSEYKYRVRDISGVEPIMPASLCKKTTIKRSDEIREVYMDDDGGYWMADSKNISVEIVE